MLYKYIEITEGVDLLAERERESPVNPTPSLASDDSPALTVSLCSVKCRPFSPIGLAVEAVRNVFH